jgi:hypothetical protein
MITVTYQDILNQAAEVAGRTRDKLPVKEALMCQGFIATALREVWNGQYQWPELIPPILAVVLGGNGVAFGNLIPNPYQPPNVTASGIPTIVGGSPGGGIVTIANGNGIYTFNPATNNYSNAGGWTLALNAGVWTLTDNTGQPRYTSPTLIAASWQTTSVATAFTAAPVAFGDVLGVWTANPQTTNRYYALRFEDEGNQLWLPDGAQATVYVEYMLPCPDINALTGSALTSYTIPTRFRNFLAWSAAGHLCRADGQVAQGDEFLALAQSEILVELRRLTPVPRRPVRQRDLINDTKDVNAMAAQQQH